MIENKKKKSIFYPNETLLEESNINILHFKNKICYKHFTNIHFCMFHFVTKPAALSSFLLSAWENLSENAGGVQWKCSYQVSSVPAEAR